MDLTGRIIAVLPAQSGVSSRTGNSWMSQDYVIEVPGQYPKRCVFRIFGEDRIKQFNIQLNEDVTVQFDIDAHEYQGRWFNDVRAFNIIRGQWLLPPRRPFQVPLPSPRHSPQLLLLMPLRSRRLRRLRPKVLPTTCRSKAYNSIVRVVA